MKESHFTSHYIDKIHPKLMADMGYTNPMEAPRLVKIVLNMGLGRKMQEEKIREGVIEILSDISGQRPVVTKAKQSIAGFKLREDVPLGVKVTLRGHRMHDFLQRFLVIAMPRIRDFRGVSSKSFDGKGNFSMGIKEHFIFPEVKYDKIGDVLGMDISIVTTAKTDREGKQLLEAFGFPFKN